MMVSSATLHQPAISRRQAVCAGLAGAIAVAAAHEGDDALADPSIHSGYIDAHVHVWTPDTKSYPLSPGFSKEEMQPSSFTPEELFDHCRPCGVTRIVLIQMSFYGYDNSYMLDVIRQDPAVFSGVAVIDEKEKPSETMQSLAGQGVRGFRIRPQVASPTAGRRGRTLNVTSPR